MTYDFHGAWDPIIGFNAPLFPGVADKTELQRQLNVNASLAYWMSEGVPPDKIVVGIPFYGRSFQLISADKNQPGHSHQGPGVGGPYTGESGNYGFNEICEYIVPNGLWSRSWNKLQAVPYYHSDKQWIGYDDMVSVGYKANYINEMNLGGAMVWSIETDDFKDLCHMGKFPLLRQINGIFGNPIIEVETQPTGTTAASTDSTVPGEDVEPECNESEPFRDPTNCASFYICSHGKRHRMQCPSTLFFDSKLKRCEYPWSVDCQAFLY